MKRKPAFSNFFRSYLKKTTTEEEILFKKKLKNISFLKLSQTTKVTCTILSKKLVY